MALTRRAMLAALAVGPLSACTPPTPAELAGPTGRPSQPPSPPPGPSSATAVPTTTSTSATPSSPPPSRPWGKAVAQGSPVSRDDVIARYSAAKPTAWGIDIPGVTTRLPTTDRVVALTFDACGGQGGCGVDQALIAVLRQHRVPATLFLNSRWIDANPAAFTELAADPLFEIGNHGTQHRPLSVTGRSAYWIAGTRNVGEVFDEVIGNRDKLARLLGSPPPFFRTGTAFCDDVALRVVGDLGQRMVNFEVNGDAGATRPARQVERALLTAKPGSIVISHLNHPGSGTAEGTASAIPKLAAAGFRFAYLSDYLH